MLNRALFPLALCILGGLGYRLVHAEPRPASAPAASQAVGTPAPSVVRPRVAWAAGERAVYDLAWQTSNTVRLGARDMTLEVEMSGQVAITGLGGDEGARRAVLEIRRVDRAKVTVDGTSLYRDVSTAADDLTGKRAAFEVDRDGALQRLAIDPDPSGLFRHLARGLLVELEVATPPGDTPSWTAVADGPSGVSRVAYAMQADGTLLRRRARYTRSTLLPGAGAALVDDDDDAAGVERPQALASRAVVRLSGTRLLAIDDDERFDVAADQASIASARSHFALDFVRAEPSSDASPPLDWQGVHDPRATDALSRRLLAQRVDGLTVAGMVKDVRIFAGAGMIPDQKRWVWRATGLLVQEPGACDELAALFVHPAMDLPARGLVLDLLASAGHTRAQETMRRALAWEGLDDEDRGELVQRFAFVAAPEPVTLDFLASLTEKSPRVPAVVYALGAALGNARGRGDVASAAPGHALLVRALAGATPETLRPALAGLGNAGFPEDALAIRVHASDADEQVRSQVAWSLRKLDAPESRATLLALAGDASTAPAMSALQVLGSLPLSAGDRRALARLRERAETTAAVRGRMDAVLAASDPENPSP